MKSNLEKDILQYGLVIGISYQFYQTTRALVPTLVLNDALVNFLITLLLVFLYVLSQRSRQIQVIAFLLHVIAMGGFTYFWIHNGGLAGTVPAFLCAYIAFIVVTSHGRYRVAGLIMLVMLVIALVTFPAWFGMSKIHDLSAISKVQTGIDYLVVTTIIVLLVLFIKRKFLFYREQVTNRNRQLKQVAQTLHAQNQELATREEETRAINDNLEALVHERTREMERKNEELAELAFINAHMLRGPVCRIIGLLQLMEKEPGRYDPAQIRHWRQLAEEIDGQIRNINQVLD